MGADWFKFVTSHIRGGSQGGRCPFCVAAMGAPSLHGDEQIRRSHLVIGIMVVLNLVGMTIAAYYFMKRKK